MSARTVAEALGFLAKTQRRRSVIVLVSDFLDDGPWGRSLATLTRRHEVHAICVSDPLDEGIARAVAWFREHRAAHPEEDVAVRRDHEGALGAASGWKTAAA